MIKFNCIIHKETGTVIKYKELVGYLEREKPSMKIIPKGSKKGYFPRDMLFSDDFIIIYDSEFTLQELNHIVGFMNTEELCNKIMDTIIKKRNLHKKYKIEV